MLQPPLPHTRSGGGGVMPEGDDAMLEGLHHQEDYVMSRGLFHVMRDFVMLGGSSMQGNYVTSLGLLYCTDNKSRGVIRYSGSCDAGGGGLLCYFVGC